MSAFEAVFGVKGEGYAIVCCDSHMQAHQIISIKDNEDKIYNIEDILIGCNGASADRTTFMEYVEKNIHLYFVDSYSSMAKVNKAAHGYAGNFVHGILDKYWKKGLTEKEGLAVIKKCIEEIKTRFVLGRLDCFKIKIVDKNGVREIKQKDLP